jgi:hypothetical protein
MPAGALDTKSRRRRLNWPCMLIWIVVLDIIMCPPVYSQLTSLYHELPEQVHGIRVLELGETSAEHDEEMGNDEGKIGRTEPMWLLSGLDF